VCGICGLVAPTGRPDPALVERMNAALVHRGPDEGSVDGFGPCVLGHRRLQVVDLVTGSQPVANESGDVVAVFNGELYNFQALRGELSGGHEVRGTGDTPVIPHLYEEHGTGFVQRLSGMFALALWDGSRDRLVLARDRVGKKPLLWTRLADGTLAFASELKALLRLRGVPREVDPDALDAYLALQYVPNGTALRGIEKLPPGHVLVFEAGSVRVEPYWRLEAHRDQLGEDEWLERVRAAVGAAVRRRLVADVPLGALLSGGIDSSVVVAEMAAAASTVRTFTVGFGEERYDERAYARAVAERYATEHEEIEVEPDVADVLPRLAQAFDEPLGDEAALPQFVVSELARRHVTVALTGDGGDEAFAGYERYAAIGLAARAAWPGAGLAARALRWAGRGEPRSRANRAGRLLEVAALPARARYGRLMEVFPAELRRELWQPEFVAAPVPAWQLLGPAPDDGIAGLQRLDVATYLPGDLLLKADVASMAHSLELRSPLLDHEVLALGVSLPDQLKLRGLRGKEALRRAYADALPGEIATRAKTGFGVPISRWFRGELRGLARELLLDERMRARGQLRPETVQRLLDDHAAGRADHGHRIWCLVMLELWQRLHVEAAAPVAAFA
jgi:asparagine synthase (glutamine-hydrolysing)